MAEILIDERNLCTCCAALAVNGDGCQCEDMAREHPAGLLELIDGYVVVGSLEPKFMVAFRGCDGCGSMLAGDYYEDCVVLR